MEECVQLLKIPSEMEEAPLYYTPHTVYTVETALEQKGYRQGDQDRLSIVQPPRKARRPEGTAR